MRSQHPLLLGSAAALLISLLSGPVYGQIVTRGAAPPPQSVVPVFQPGNTYRFVTSTRVVMMIPGQGPREVSIEQQARLDVGVRSDGKTGTSIRATTERLKVKLKSGDRLISYDSLEADDRESRLGQHFQGSLLRWVDLTLDERSRVVASETGGRAGIATPFPGLPQFGPDELEQLVASIPQGLSDEPVIPGDEWVLQGSRPIGQVGEVAFDVTYRYNGFADFEGILCSEIELSGDLSGDVAIQSGDGLVSAERMDFSGRDLTGRILFDPLEKMLRHSNQTVRMVLDLPTSSGGTPVSVPVEQQATITLLHIVPTPID